MSLSTFSAVRTEGGLLPPEILSRILAGDPDLPGTDQAAYHVPKGERVGEAVNRSWSRLRGLWPSFREALEKRGEEDAASGLTRERWLLPLFGELGYGRLQRAGAMEIEGKSFALSHEWHRSPIHLVGAGVPLDRRSRGVAGAAQAAPHSLVQEFLNRSEPHLWAFVSNGRVLRILRDNYSLSRQAYVEFDLEAIFNGELFSDFRLLWLVCHQSRVEAEEPEECWLETWFQLSRDEGIRALDRLRDGVAEALEVLGSGFLRHPENRVLQEALRTGALDRQDYYRELLRIAYRLIFLFVAEDRDALLDPEGPPAALDRYRRFYHSGRIRTLAAHRRGTRHSDLWTGLNLVLRKLHDGEPALGLPALGSFLWRSDALHWTGDVQLQNEDLLKALRALCYLRDGKQRFPVNWRTVGAEELGSIYESLLELHPRIERKADKGAFRLVSAAGNERKTTGSYYTPTSLVDTLLDSALEPLLEEAMRAPDPEAALLDLKVCDTAVGSGHFIVAAARRIAMRLASVRTGDEEASPEAVTTALRDVVGRCVYGVDLNPLAAELCKVSLWIEALEPGRPLSFLDQHIQVGNSLLGTTPALIRQGIPDDAFQPIEGDEKKEVSALRKRNRQERRSQQIGLGAQLVQERRSERYQRLRDTTVRIEASGDATLAAVLEKEAAFQQLQDDPAYRGARLVADAWCAAFVWPKRPGAPHAITEEVFRGIQADPEDTDPGLVKEIRHLARQYRFFHFQLAFPEVFGEESDVEDGDPRTGWEGGFDLVIGNPPWEHTELKEKEWFSTRNPSIAEAPGAKRKRLIAALTETDPTLHGEFLAAKREADGLSHFVRNSGRYPLCGRGRINTYAIFAEGDREILAAHGRMGIIVPSGIATDDTTKYFFQDLMDSESLVSLYDFENRAKVFPAVDSRMKFCLLTVGGRAHQHTTGAEFAFFLHSTRELEDEERRFILSAEDIALLNPNTRTCPIFRTRRDAEITKGIYRRVPVLVKEGDPDGNPWGVTFKQGLFNMTSDSHLFRTREELENPRGEDGQPEKPWELVENVFERDGERYLPLYEAKMIHHFDYQWATYENGGFRDVTEAEKADPAFHVMPRYWVPEVEVEERLDGLWDEEWLLGFRDICRSTDERTVIASLFPRAGVGNNLPIVVLESDSGSASILGSMLSSFVVDFAARFKVGGTHLNFFLANQLPVLGPSIFSANRFVQGEPPLSEWIQHRVQLLIGAEESEGGARSTTGPKRTGDSLSRRVLRAELDACWFQLYGLSREDIDYIMDTFPIVSRKDIAEFGEYRTKRMILEEYDRIRSLVNEAGPVGHGNPAT